jgi:hypothetical protein
MATEPRCSDVGGKCHLTDPCPDGFCLRTATEQRATGDVLRDNRMALHRDRLYQDKGPRHIEKDD